MYQFKTERLTIRKKELKKIPIILQNTSYLTKRQKLLRIQYITNKLLEAKLQEADNLYVIYNKEKYIGIAVLKYVNQQSGCNAEMWIEFERGCDASNITNEAIGGIIELIRTYWLYDNVILNPNDPYQKKYMDYKGCGDSICTTVP